MFFQFLIEDQSGATLIEVVMEKIKTDYPDITYNIKSFKGLGGFTKKNTVKETKTGKLLNDLATYMRGFNKSLQHFAAAIFVVLDNDDNDPMQFKRCLEDVANANSITVDHVFCLAVEEIEAWLLGDEAAILSAYPKARLAVLHSYKQDSICGTWEVLADVVYNGGQNTMKKQHYSEQGLIKNNWAKSIGAHLTISSNKSPSFNLFVSEVVKRANIS